MDIARITELRDEMCKTLATANASMTATVRGWLRDLPALDATTAEEWLAVLECVSDKLDERVRKGADSVATMRLYLGAYDLCGEALRLLADEPAKASCEADCVSGCSACDGAGVVFEDAEAA